MIHLWYATKKPIPRCWILQWWLGCTDRKDFSDKCSKTRFICRIAIARAGLCFYCYIGLIRVTKIRVKWDKSFVNNTISQLSPNHSPLELKKVDDALSVETLPDGGGERIWVHIADVSRWVSEGSPLYHEARSRRTTTYLAEGSVPMFPADVAHGVLSLR